jgi:hypothetical protein
LNQLKQEIWLAAESRSASDDVSNMGDKFFSNPLFLEGIGTIIRERLIYKSDHAT